MFITPNNSRFSCITQNNQGLRKYNIVIKQKAIVQISNSCLDVDYAEFHGKMKTIPHTGS